MALVEERDDLVWWRELVWRMPVVEVDRVRTSSLETGDVLAD
jgi:hypothetical protein